MRFGFMRRRIFLAEIRVYPQVKPVKPEGRHFPGYALARSRIAAVRD
jgi:hypothetical protein